MGQTVFVPNGGGGSSPGAPALVPTDIKIANYVAQPGEQVLIQTASAEQELTVTLSPGVNSGDLVAVLHLGGGDSVIVASSSPGGNLALNVNAELWGATYIWDTLTTDWYVQSTVYVPQS